MLPSMKPSFCGKMNQAVAAVGVKFVFSAFIKVPVSYPCLRTVSLSFSISVLDSFSMTLSCSWSSTRAHPCVLFHPSPFPSPSSVLSVSPFR